MQAFKVSPCCVVEARLFYPTDLDSAESKKTPDLLINECNEHAILISKDFEIVHRRKNGEMKQYACVNAYGEAHCMEKFRNRINSSYHERFDFSYPSMAIDREPAFCLVTDQCINGSMTRYLNDLFMMFDSTITCVIPSTMKLMNARSCDALRLYKFVYSESFLIWMQNNSDILAVEWGMDHLIAIVADYLPQSHNLLIGLVDIIKSDDVDPCSIFGDIKRCVAVPSETKQKVCVFTSPIF